MYSISSDQGTSGVVIPHEVFVQKGRDDVAVGLGSLR